MGQYALKAEMESMGDLNVRKYFVFSRSKASPAILCSCKFMYI